MTHVARMGGDSLNLWQRLRSALAKLEDTGKLAFWLFQMPPDYSASEENIESLSKFFRNANLRNKQLLNSEKKAGGIT
jgi:uncharacterized protein YecE (DUF72 family)